ncbi:MAG: hypothetical protein M1537_03090 [Nitrospirae bacterium]|nr:hypothetical protein [Nitrospirota bacterium]
MPYSNQKAGKGGHIDLVKNPDVGNFLSSCDYIHEPTEEEGESIAATFHDAPFGGLPPEKVVASDASQYMEPINGKFPSTQIGYIKLSLMLVNMADYDGLIKPGIRFVDPFKVASLHRNADAIAFTLPGSNIRYKGASTVKDGFRLAVWEQLSDARTNFSKSGPYCVADTLFAISNGLLTVKKCPGCDFQPEDEFQFRQNNPVQNCPRCGISVYATDSLRLFEEISDFGSNASPITRFMNAIEHLTMASLIRMLSEQQPTALSKMAFFIDGPLAVFGQPAWISKRLMGFYHRISQDLITRGLRIPVIIGLQKEGMAMDHSRSINRFVGSGKYRVIDDEYRKQYISASASKTPNFGDETYYGQDFIFKTEKGQIFVVGVPYPFPNKQNKEQFAKDKVNVSNYPDLGCTFDLIRHFEFDLYQSAIVPVALAHRHASISLVPGGKVLDLISRHGLGLH